MLSLGKLKKHNYTVTAIRKLWMSLVMEKWELRRGVQASAKILPALISDGGDATKWIE